MNQAVEARTTRGSGPEYNPAEKPDGGQSVASKNGEVDLTYAETERLEDGGNRIRGEGSVTVDGKPPLPDGGNTAEVEVEIETHEQGGRASVTIRGDNVSDDQAEKAARRALTESGSDLLGSGAIDGQTAENVQGMLESPNATVNIGRNPDGSVTVSFDYTRSVDETPDSPGARAEQKSSHQAAEQAAQRGYSAAGGRAAAYSGGGGGGGEGGGFAATGGARGAFAGDVGEELEGMGSTGKFRFAEQGNVPGRYFQKTADGGINARVSTSDRRPGFWNGNRAEIAFDKFSGGQKNGFSSWFNIKDGVGYSIFQLFNQAGGEGFPEVMLSINKNGELIIGGRAMNGKHVNLGKVPPDGNLGVNFVNTGNGGFEIQVLGGTQEAPTVIGSAAGQYTQPGGEFHYRAGPYFNGYNNKEYGADFNQTADVIIYDPKMHSGAA